MKIRRFLIFTIVWILPTILVYQNRNILKDNIRPNLLDQPYKQSDSINLLMPNYSYDYIIRLHDNNNNFFCSGFVIDDNYAITAAHCVNREAGLMENIINIYDSKSRATGVIALAAGMHNIMDYAIIRGDFRQFNRVQIETNKVEIDKDGYYMACGFPLGNKKLFCSKVQLTGPQVFAIVGDGYLYPGMSGGPLIDLTTNKVIGVNSYMYREGAGFYPLVGILDSFGI